MSELLLRKPLLCSTDIPTSVRQSTGKAFHCFEFDFPKQTLPTPPLLLLTPSSLSQQSEPGPNLAQHADLPSTADITQLVCAAPATHWMVSWKRDPLCLPVLDWILSWVFVLYVSIFGSLTGAVKIMSSTDASTVIHCICLHGTQLNTRIVCSSNVARGHLKTNHRCWLEAETLCIAVSPLSNSALILGAP